MNDPKRENAPADDGRLETSASLTGDTMEAMKLTAKIRAADTMKRNIRGAQRVIGDTTCRLTRQLSP